MKIAANELSMSEPMGFAETNLTACINQKYALYIGEKIHIRTQGLLILGIPWG